MATQTLLGDSGSPNRTENRGENKAEGGNKTFSRRV